MWQYSKAPRTRKYVKGYGFLLFTKKNKQKNTGLNASKK